MTECVFCGIEIEVMEAFNGEPSCKECYNNEDNFVFGDEEDDVNG